MADLDLSWPTTSEDDKQLCKFSVTNQGILYCKEGHFEGSLAEAIVSGNTFRRKKTSLHMGPEGFYFNENGFGLGNFLFQSNGEIHCDSFYGRYCYIASDIRLKNNIEPLDLSNFFDNLKPVSFKYNVDKDNIGRIGFIADDVKENMIQNNMNLDEWGFYIKEMPNAENGPIQGLCYTEFIALNTSEIQKLKKKMDDLERKMTLIKELDAAEKNSYNINKDIQGDN